jgi:competence protein ComEC
VQQVIALTEARASWRAWLDWWVTAERGRFALWLPVAMGSGVLGYFALRGEPPLWAGAAVLGPALLGAWLARDALLARGALLVASAAALGFGAAQFATVRAPPLEMLPTHAVVLSGVVRSVETLPAGRRVTLEAARLDEAAPLNRFVHVRLRTGDPLEPTAGDSLRVRALLRPPAPPAYPGGWDLQRDAWFSGLGASGYALAPAERTGHIALSGPLRLLQSLRETIARRIAAAIPGSAGAVSVTLLTGSATSIPVADHDAFRASGLAHLLAVAGLHIGIVMAWVLAFSRVALATSEHASLYWPTRQLAALAALTAGGGYMMLTGMHVPIVRSFTMACLFTVAMLAGRRAVSLRGLALAATALMLIEPQQVPGVSFQMSFSAVLALIAGYEALRPRLIALRGSGNWRRRVASHVAALALTSALAGTASAPFGAYHFGRIQLYFVLANMIAVPITALWVMPAGLIALALMPLGLDRFALVPMGWGAQVVVWVARTTAVLPAATLSVPHIPSWGLAVLSLGIAWLGLWRSRLRLIGIALIACGLVSPLLTRPPDLLVSADARLIAVRTDAGMFVQQMPGAARFTREAWQQYWAMASPQRIPLEGSAADGAIVCAKDACMLHPVAGAKGALLVRGATHPDGCADASVIVSSEPARRLCPPPWPALVDRFSVWRYGATAIWLDRERARVLTDRAYRGERPWVPPLPTPRARAAPTLPMAPTDQPAPAE